MKKIVAKVGQAATRLLKTRNESFQRLGSVSEWERT